MTIDPDARDESVARFKEYGVVEPEGAKLLGAWISVSQLATWSVIEADSAEALMKLFEPWTDLNVHQITPMMDFAALKEFADANA